MHFSFDSIFFLSFGLLSIVAGILKKDMLFWTSIKYDGLRDLLGQNYKRVINITLGIISVFIGLHLLKN